MESCMSAKATSLQDLANAIRRLLSCCELSVANHQLRVVSGDLVLSVMEDTDAFIKDRFVLVRVKPEGDFLCGNLSPVDLIREVVSTVTADR